MIDRFQRQITTQTALTDKDKCDYSHSLSSIVINSIVSGQLKQKKSVSTHL